jgi:hypothetical protein
MIWAGATALAEKLFQRSFFTGIALCIVGVSVECNKRFDVGASGVFAGGLAVASAMGSAKRGSHKKS